MKYAVTVAGMVVVAENDGAVSEDFGDEGSLVVEDQRFAIVPEWVITAEVSDAAFRAYSMLLRFGGTSGCRMPSRALLARRLHRSVDSVDRALRELVSAGPVRVERRRRGHQFFSNRYHVRTSAPCQPGAEAGGGRTFAATPVAEGGSRKSPATPGRTSAARVAANMRPYPEGSTDRPPPPGDSPTPSAPSPPKSAVNTADDELLQACGIGDIDELSRRCMAARTALGQPTTRWTPQCLSLAIRMAVVNRGWPVDQVRAALLEVAADRQTRSPVRVAEAGPWWDSPTHNDPPLDDGLPALEERLVELGGHRPALQAQARAELAGEGLPLTRETVTRRAVQILDRADEPA